MPEKVLYIIIIFSVCILLPAIVISIVSFKNVKQHLTKTIDGHKIEIRTGYRFASLILDGQVVDQFKTLNTSGIKLNGKIENKNIIVNISGGFIKPKIITFINAEKENDLSNC